MGTPARVDHVLLVGLPKSANVFIGRPLKTVKVDDRADSSTHFRRGKVRRHRGELTAAQVERRATLAGREVFGAYGWAV